MLTRSPSSPASFSQRALAQRRLRRSATHRLLCNTNGCATFLEVDADQSMAVCPICGYSRRAMHAPEAVAAH